MIYYQEAFYCDSPITLSTRLQGTFVLHYAVREHPGISSTPTCFNLQHLFNTFSFRLRHPPHSSLLDSSAHHQLFNVTFVLAITSLLLQLPSLFPLVFCLHYLLFTLSLLLTISCFYRLLFFPRITSSSQLRLFGQHPRRSHIKYHRHIASFNITIISTTFSVIKRFIYDSPNGHNVFYLRKSLTSHLSGSRSPRVT